MIKDSTFFDSIDFSDLFDSIMDKETQRKQNKNHAKQNMHSNIYNPFSVYISHPYSDHVKENVKHAEILAGKLARQFPHIMFFNPLNAMRHLEIIKMDYDNCLKQCLYWLDKCDGIIMADGLIPGQNSTGCVIEHDQALSKWKHVWNSVQQFEADINQFMSVR